MIVKQGQPKLKKVEIQSGLLDPFIKLAMIRKEALNVLQLRD